MNISILGATGAVGREMLALVRERFPGEGVRLFASARSAGETVSGITVEALPEDPEWASELFRGTDAVLSALPADMAEKYLPPAAECGAVCIDNSSAFRHHPEVPLVIPHLNGDAVRPGPGIIANPNCSTAIALTALGGIIKRAGLRSVTAATYQAASGAGAGGLAELESQLSDAFAPAEVFPKRLAMNVIPFIGRDMGGITSEEGKMQAEGRKILGLPELSASCVCVRVPVRRCHSIALWVHTERKLSFREAEEACMASPGCVYMAEGFPTPLDAESRNEVFTGRLRTEEGGRIFLWCCGDQLLRGAALNAVEILEKWAEI